MGWLGWSPAEALGADINVVKLAVHGRIDLLQMIFGKGPEGGPPKGSIADRFKESVRRHNIGYRKRERRRKREGD